MLILMAMTFSLALPVELPPRPDFCARRAELTVQVANKYARWRPVFPVILYAGTAGGDLVSTEWSVRRGWREMDPLPGMQHTLGRCAWSVVMVGTLLVIDRALTRHHHHRWVHALRIVMGASETATIANNFHLIHFSDHL